MELVSDAFYLADKDEYKKLFKHQNPGWKVWQRRILPLTHEDGKPVFQRAPRDAEFNSGYNTSVKCDITNRTFLVNQFEEDGIDVLYFAGFLENPFNQTAFQNNDKYIKSITL